MQNFNLIKPYMIQQMAPMGRAKAISTGASRMGRLRPDYKRVRDFLEQARQQNLSRKVIRQRERAVRAMENLIYKNR